jgi:xanthine dehydrogenase YagS FAD-binding subunit
MKNFEHVNASSVEEAIALLESAGNARAIAGGTDLLTRLKLEMDDPDRLVNLKTIPGLAGIVENGTGLDIGALATLDSIASSAVVNEHYPLLARAIRAAASPQLRNFGTIGGNLCQYNRCWYFRGPFQCWLKHGAICFALEGENKNHAIFGGGPCYSIHPSDTAPVLIALQADVSISGRNGSRTLPVEDFFRLPREDSRQVTVLEPGEIITGIHIPRPDEGSAGVFLKAMERRVWSFAQASIAVQMNFENREIKDARIVLGGVAPVPWRLPRLETSFFGERIHPVLIVGAAEMAVAGAMPLSHNRYKIPLVKGLLTEALTQIAKIR